MITPFTYDEDELIKHRLTLEGGEDYIRTYLQQHSRESVFDFRRRMNSSYNPGHAKAAVQAIVEASVARLGAVSRSGGSKSYQAAVNGDYGGVDGKHNTMQSFLATAIVQELCFMGRVGILVDTPSAVSAFQNPEEHPFFKVISAENILSLEWSPNGRLIEATLRVRDYSGGCTVTYSLKEPYVIEGPDGIITVMPGTETCNRNGALEPERRPMYHNCIPFSYCSLPTSLLRDIADHQIAELNMASQDLFFLTDANVIMLTEQVSAMNGAMHKRLNNVLNLPPGVGVSNPTDEALVSGILPDGSKLDELGSIKGKTYGEKLERPGFIAPPAEPLMASMAKQRDIRESIDRILYRTLASFQSSDSSNSAMEAGLACIGLQLERTERELAFLWHLLESGQQTLLDVSVLPTIAYPEEYSLKTMDERIAEADKLYKIKEATTSGTFQRAVQKDIVHVLFGNRLSSTELAKIYREIDEAPGTTSDPTIIAKDIESGVLSPSTGSIIRGYPKGEALKAHDEKVQRLTEIALAQGVNPMDNGVSNLEARGLDAGTGDAKSEKQGKARRGDTNATNYSQEDHAHRRLQRADKKGSQ